MARRGRRDSDAALQMALACGATVESAARAANVSVATVHRRRKDPEFEQGVQKLRAEMVARTTGMLTAAGGEAVKALHLLLQDQKSSVRLGASRVILEFGARFRESSELEARIAALEQTLRDKAA